MTTTMDLPVLMDGSLRRSTVFAGRAERDARLVEVGGST